MEENDGAPKVCCSCSVFHIFCSLYMYGTCHDL